MQLLVILYGGVYGLNGIDDHLNLNGWLGLINQSSSVRRSLWNWELTEQRDEIQGGRALSIAPKETQIPTQLLFGSNVNKQFWEGLTP